MQAKATGSYLAAVTGNAAKRPVFVFIDRSISTIVSFFGVVYSGNFYVPVDSQLPANRIQLMIETIRPAAIIYSGENIPGPGLVYEGPVVKLSEAVSCPAADSLLDKIRRGHLDIDPLYAMFTSGTTGIPKGALISHRGVIDLAEGFAEVFELSEDCSYCNCAPFDFDVSTKDIYLNLKCMGTMHIAPKMAAVFPVQLIEFLNERKINTLIWATSVLRVIHSSDAFEAIRPEHLRLVMFSGEVMPNKVLNYWRKHFPEVEFVNLYGPTEITCNCTYFKVNRDFSDAEPLPIGNPFPNTGVLLLDGDKQVSGPGAVGEICVGGTCLALGYYNDMARTMESFVRNPLNPAYPQTIYRTGDLGCYNSFGELVFIGRSDHQIKYLGHRIELGEIEGAVNALDFLDFGCCIYDDQSEKIVLFYQAAEKCEKRIMSSLMLMLPKYMIPKKMVYYQRLPLNKNGKIDRALLKQYL